MVFFWTAVWQIDTWCSGQTSPCGLWTEPFCRCCSHNWYSLEIRRRRRRRCQPRICWRCYHGPEGHRKFGQSCFCCSFLSWFFNRSPPPPLLSWFPWSATLSSSLPESSNSCCLNLITTELCNRLYGSEKMGNFPKILQNQTIAFTGHLQFCMSCESAEICVQSHAWPLLGGARNLLPPRIITVILSSVAIQNSGLCLVFYPEEESLNTLCSLESRKIMARLHGPLVLEMSMNHRTEEDTVLSRLTIGDMVSSSEKYTVVKSKIRHDVTREVCSGLYLDWHLRTPIKQSCCCCYQMLPSIGLQTSLRPTSPIKLILVCHTKNHPQQTPFW